jgi:hypothetical protein
MGFERFQWYVTAAGKRDFERTRRGHIETQHFASGEALSLYT